MFRNDPAIAFPTTSPPHFGIIVMIIPQSSTLVNISVTFFIFQFQACTMMRNGVSLSSDLNRRPIVTPKNANYVSASNLRLFRKSRLLNPRSDKFKILIIKAKREHPLQVFSFWSYWPDLNRRPADYESAALPTEPQ